MALVLVVETGAGIEGANSYASRADGDTYHEGRLHSSAWTGATNETKEQALVMATRFLDSNVEWKGIRNALSQALGWPRRGALWDGHEVPRDMVPRPVINATCELARLLIGADLQAEQDSDNVKAINLGQSALVIDFKDDSKTRRIPLAIGELLQGLGATTSGGGITQRRLVR
jgi:hypothetical protein